ncbi:hypothetical protein BV22DRAFT_1036702 [Leucogyrophana mollusca]|uniref:Uncharacterized protein n=1 Tax=Leucogyrophana mollusca TaxID=85980 RepID=A0ACB8BD50_9AGAM|nr:hypothetical protein BV22DRAFT_1036702 [Leucogyrophana mollusca]
MGWGRVDREARCVDEKWYMASHVADSTSFDLCVLAVWHDVDTARYPPIDSGRDPRPATNNLLILARDLSLRRIAATLLLIYNATTNLVLLNAPPALGDELGLLGCRRHIADPRHGPAAGRMPTPFMTGVVVCTSQYLRGGHPKWLPFKG